MQRWRWTVDYWMMIVLLCGGWYDASKTTSTVAGAAVVAAAAAMEQVPQSQEDIEQQATALQKENPEAAKAMWKHVLKHYPKSKNAHQYLGMTFMVSPNSKIQSMGMQLLGRLLDPEAVDDAIPITVGNALAYMIADVVGRWYISKLNANRAIHFLFIAKYVKPNDICVQMQLAFLDPFPLSKQEADDSLRLCLVHLDALLQLGQRAKNEDGTGAGSARALTIDPWVIQTVPGASNDPYVHCMSTLFYLSFYYRADMRQVASKHFQLSTMAWPNLLYVSPAVEAAAAAIEDKTNNNHNDNVPAQVACEYRKIRLGIASAFLTQVSSVTSDFKGMLTKLDRDIFDVTYIYVGTGKERIASFIYDHSNDTHILVNVNAYENPEWLQAGHKDIEELNLDLLLYLDATMSPSIHRIAMARLAPVQAISHGHPITSGIDSTIMNYYISWAGAELPYETSKHHYTEKLKLLPANTIHQYYSEGKVTSDGESSLSDNLPFKHLVDEGRARSFPGIPSDGNWYLCMQKPFKLHPEFDDFVVGIMKLDKHAKVILHKTDSNANHKKFMQRLSQAGCDMERVFFVPVQQHHRLLALYSLSDVILDSYPAGGCTTTREVLELGKALVTLPAKYLGSRWSLGLYNIIADEEGLLLPRVVATTAEEYIQLAIDLGTNVQVREHVEAIILENVHKLFRQNGAVEEWTKILLEIAPLEVATKYNRFCKDTLLHDEAVAFVGDEL